jgi:denticleless
MVNNPLSGAKNGGTPLLAIATEQGTVHILDTTKRRDWDYGMALLVITPTLTS